MQIFNKACSLLENRVKRTQKSRNRIKSFEAWHLFYWRLSSQFSFNCIFLRFVSILTRSVEYSFLSSVLEILFLSFWSYWLKTSFRVNELFRTRTELFIPHNFWIVFVVTTIFCTIMPCNLSNDMIWNVIVDAIIFTDVIKIWKRF